MSLGLFTFSNTGSVVIVASSDESRIAVADAVELRPACDAIFVQASMTFDGVNTNDFTPETQVAFTSSFETSRE